MKDTAMRMNHFVCQKRDHRPSMKRAGWLALLFVALLSVGNEGYGAVTLVDYFNLQTYGTVSGGQVITAAGNHVFVPHSTHQC